jgi:hypothetical protein
MIKQETPNLNADFYCYTFCTKDSGCEGREPTASSIYFIVPIKANREASPCDEDKQQINESVSSIRIISENAIIGMKPLKMASETVRKFTSKKTDRIAVVTASPQNFRCELGSLAYTAKALCA